MHWPCPARAATLMAVLPFLRRTCRKEPKQSSAVYLPLKIAKHCLWVVMVLTNCGFSKEAGVGLVLLLVMHSL